MKIKKSVILITIFAFAILSLPFQAGAVVDWTKDTANNPVLSAGGGGAWDEDFTERPAVIKDGATYKMWYSGAHSSGTTVQIGYATSGDGTSWTKDGGNPVLSPSASGWDSANVGFCWVIKSGTSYYMWYSGNDVPGDDETDLQIGYATSSDGTTWTKGDSGVTDPVLEYGSGVSDWDADGVVAPTVIYDASATTPYKMWYIGFNDTLEIEGIGYADSADGVNWTKYNDPNTDGASGDTPYANSDPVIFPGNEGAWDEWPFSPSVIKEGSIYRMWYDGEKEIGDQGEELLRIGYAYSLDGITWTKYIGSPVILQGGQGDFDEDGALDPMVIKDGNTYKMWYAGDSNCVGWDCDTAIGYATSPAYPQDAYLDIEATHVSVYQNGWGLIFMCWPAGPGPLDINELKVTGPNGFSYVFPDSDIQNVSTKNESGLQFPGVSIHNSQLPGGISTGQYTFSVTANSGVSVSDSLNLTSTTGIPIPPDGTGAGQLDRFIDVSGVTYEHQTYIGTTTPTFKWKPCSGTTYYYRAYIRDWTTRAIWYVGAPVEGTQTDDGYMSTTIAAGTLKENTPYKWQVEVLDTDNVWSACARSRSGYYDFYTGTKSGVSDFLWWAGVMSQRSNYAGDKTMPVAFVHNLAPWDIDTTTGGNEFRVEKSGGTPFSYYFDINNSHPDYDENDAVTIGDSDAPFEYAPIEMMENNFPRYWLTGFPEDGTYDFYVYEDGTSNHETISSTFTGDTDLPIVEKDDRTPHDNAYLNTNEPTLTWKSAGRWKWHRVMIVDWNVRRSPYVSDYMDGVDAGQDMSLKIPPGILSEYSPYRWMVEVFDENRHNRTRASLLSFVTGEEAYHPGQKLAVDFGANGLSKWDGSSFASVSSWNPEVMETWGSQLAVDFGVGNGLYTYDNITLTKRAGSNPEDLKAWGLNYVNLAVDFGSGVGFYTYDGSTWTKLADSDPEDLEGWDDALVVDFGTGVGLYKYDGTWSKIAGSSPTDLCVWGELLVVNFGPGIGLYTYDGSTWNLVAGSTVENAEPWGTMLAVDFGASGLFLYDGTWTKIANSDPESMLAWGDALAVDFGTAGVGFYENGSWSLTPANAQSLAIYGDKLVADFGATWGLWEYDGSMWTKINDWDVDNTDDSMVDYDLSN